MTLDHGQDPFNKKANDEEARRDREAALKEQQIQESRRTQAHRQQLEAEKRRIEDQIKNKKDELARENQNLAELQEKKTSAESKAKESRAIVTSRESSSARSSKQSKIKTRIQAIDAQILQLKTHKQVVVESSSSGVDTALERKLATARAAVEQTALEHVHITDEIRQLKRLLAEKEEAEGKIKTQKTKTEKDLHDLEAKREGAEGRSRENTQQHKKDLDDAAENKERIGLLEKEREELKGDLKKLDEDAEHEDTAKERHAREAADAVSESVRAGNSIRDIERRRELLQREISIEEGKLRDIQSQLEKIPRA
ncbi:MAG: hypothetical protein KBD16_01455 [Candidatus Pacebacteria bacterium]|nr:hypothetical protein [Candidatus Paceibacterota bacterium]